MFAKFDEILSMTLYDIKLTVYTKPLRITKGNNFNREITSTVLAPSP